VATGRKIDAAVERGLDLRVDAEVLHQGRLLLVALDARYHVRVRLLQVRDDALVCAVVVDVRLLEVAGEQVARDAQRQLRFLVDERRGLHLVRAGLNRLPEPLQEDEVALDVLLGRAFRGRADDHAAFLDVQLLEDVLQALALVVVEAARDAEALALRDEDDEAAGQRDLCREPRALRLHRILDRLHEDRLALADQVLDLAAVVLSLELGDDDLVHVEEAVLLEADLDERGLHSRQDVVDLAEVDVAGDRPALGPLEVDLGDLVVLEDGDALLAHIDGHEQLALRVGERGALLRLAAAALRRSRQGSGARAAGHWRKTWAYMPLGQQGTSGPGQWGLATRPAPQERGFGSGSPSGGGPKVRAIVSDSGGDHVPAKRQAEELL